MSSFAQTLSKTRVVVLSFLCILSLALLIPNVQFAHILMGEKSTLYSSVAFNLAVSVITMVTVLGMLIAGFMVQDPFTSWTVVEIGWLGFLDILWLAASADISSLYQQDGFVKGCSDPEVRKSFSDFVPACTDFQASMAFGWMGWILLSAYWGTLLTFAIKSAKNGSPIWKSTLRTVGAGRAASSEFSSTPAFEKAQHQQSIPPQARHEMV